MFGSMIISYYHCCYKYFYHHVSLYEPRVNSVEEKNVGKGYLNKSCRKKIFTHIVFVFRSQSSTSSDDHKKRLEAVRFSSIIE